MINKKKQFTTDLIVFLIVFLSGSYVVTNGLVPSFAIIVSWIVLFIAFFLKIKKIDFRIIVAFVLLSSLMFISDLVNNEDMLVTFKAIFSFAAICLFANSFSFTEFTTSFRRVIFPVCFISIFLFLIFTFYTPMQSFFHDERGLCNLLIFIYYPGMKRNFGMFWEPGAFQIFINFALFFELFDKKPRIHYIIIFTLALITTFSTTGFIALAVLFIYYLLAKGLKTPKAKILFLAGVVCFAAFVIIGKDFLFNDSNGDAVFGKITGFFDNEDYKSDRYTSASIRFFAITKPFEAFFTKPFLGYGYEGLNLVTQEYTLGMNTCTVIDWFANYGAFFGLVCSIGYFGLGKYYSNKAGFMIFMSVFLFLVICTENMVRNPFIITLILYGYGHNNYVKTIKNRSIISKKSLLRGKNESIVYQRF